MFKYRTITECDECYRQETFISNTKYSKVDIDLGVYIGACGCDKGGSLFVVDQKKMG